MQMYIQYRKSLVAFPFCTWMSFWKNLFAAFSCVKIPVWACRTSNEPSTFVPPQCCFFKSFIFFWGEPSRCLYRFFFPNDWKYHSTIFVMAKQLTYIHIMFPITSYYNSMQCVWDSGTLVYPKCSSSSSAEKIINWGNIHISGDIFIAVNYSRIIPWQLQVILLFISISMTYFAIPEKHGAGHLRGPPLLSLFKHFTGATTKRWKTKL